MKLIPAILVLLLLTPSAAIAFPTSAIPGPNPGQGETGFFSISQLPAAAVLDDSITFSIKSLVYQDGPVFTAIYKESGDRLLLEHKETKNLVKGALLLDHYYLGKNAGRYHLVILVDLFHVGNFLPGEMPLSSLSTLSGKKSSEVVSFFVHPAKFATMSQDYDNILGDNNNTLRVALWQVRGDTYRESAWSNLEPSKLLGSLYVPASGVVYIYDEKESYSSGHYIWTVNVNTSGGAMTRTFFGAQERSTLHLYALPEYFFYSDPNFEDWHADVVMSHHPSTFWTMDTSGVALGGSMAVTLSKRTFSLSQFEFDSEMKALGSEGAVLEKRADAFVPAQGTAYVYGLFTSGDVALRVARDTVPVDGTTSIVLPAPYPGKYYVAVSYDSDVNYWVPDGVFQWSYYHSFFDDFCEVGAPGDVLEIGPVKELFAPGEPVSIVCRSTGPFGVRLLCDGTWMPVMPAGGLLTVGPLSPGVHKVYAVLDLPASDIVTGKFTIKELTDLAWVASTDVVVGKVRTSLVIQQEMVGGLETSMRVLVHDASLLPVKGASVDARFKVNAGSGNSILNIGSAVTDDDGACVMTFTPPANVNTKAAYVEVTATYGGDFQVLKMDAALRSENRLGFVSTDKPMYKGGDVIKAKFVVWSLDRLGPSKDPMMFSFINPDGRVLYQEKLDLDQYGTADTTLPVGSDTVWGTYWITLRTGDKTLARKAVILKPYTLPMTKLTLSSDSNILQLGEDCSVSAYAEYTLFNAPVGDGLVSYKITAYAAPTVDTVVHEYSGASSEQGQGQAQGQGQGSGSSSSSSQATEEVSSQMTEQEYIDTLVELYSWEDSIILEDGGGFINFTVPPMACAFKLDALFEDSLEHTNEASSILFVGEMPSLTKKALEISSSDSVYSPNENIDITLKSSAQFSAVTVSVMVADAEGNTISLPDRMLFTDSEGRLSTTLAGMGVDVKDLLVRGYYSYIVSAKLPKDDSARCYSAFTVYRYIYSMATEKTIYNAGDTVHVQLGIADETDLLGLIGTPRDETFIVRIDGIGGTLVELAGVTIEGLGMAEWNIPADARTGPYSLKATFESATVEKAFEVMGQNGLRMDAKILDTTEDTVSVEVSFNRYYNGPVFVDGWSSAGTLATRMMVDGSAQNVLITRPDCERPLSLSVYAFTTDGLKARTLVVEPERTPLSLQVTTDKKNYEPGELVNVTITSDRAAMLFMGIVSNALYDTTGTPTLEKEWFDELALFWGNLTISSNWAVVTPEAGELKLSAEGYYPTKQTCPLPYQPTSQGQGQGNGQNGGGSDGNGNGGAGQGQGQGQQQQGGSSSGASDQPTGTEFIPKDMDLSDEMKNDMAGLKMRKWFTDAAYWNTSIIISEGITKLTIKLPDNVRTWRITTVGMTSWCTGNVSVVKFNVKKPFYVEMKIPTTLTQDDEVLFKAFVYNFANVSVRVKVAFSASSWLKVFGDNEKWLDMEPNTVEMVPFYVKVAAPGKQNLTLLATDFGAYRDGVFAEVNVAPNGIKKTTLRSGEVVDEETFDILLSPWTVKESFSAKLAIHFGYDGLVIGGLEYLTSYPYGCVEQTTSLTIPNIIVWRYMQSAGTLKGEFKEMLKSNILTGIEKLYKFQNADGGWGWFGSDRNTYMTSYVLFGLSLIRDGGFFVDQNVINAGINALVHSMNPDGTWPGSHYQRGKLVASTAFTTYVLALAGATDAELWRPLMKLQEFWASNAQYDSYDVAMLSMAFQEAGRPNGAQVLWLLMNKQGPIWSGSALAGDYEATGWAAYTLIKSGEWGALEDTMKHLVDNRYQSWHTTSSTIAILMAMNEAIPYGDVSDNTTVDLYLDGERVNKWVRGRSLADFALTPYITGERTQLTMVKKGAGYAFFGYQQSEFLRPAVAISYPSNIDAVAGKVFDLKVRATLAEGYPEGVSITNLGCSLPSHNGLDILSTSVNGLEGEVTYRMTAQKAGSYMINPVVPSYQLDGGEGTSSLIREYLGPVNVTIRKEASTPQPEVMIEKLVDRDVLRQDQTVLVSLKITSWGSAVGHSAEIRDYIPGELTKVETDGSSLPLPWNEPGSEVTMDFPNEKRWRLTLGGINWLIYRLRVDSEFFGDIGSAVVLLDGYVQNVSEAPTISTVTSDMFVTKWYSTLSSHVNEPITVTLKYGFESSTSFYLAVEDTLPPGFEADEGSVKANLDDSLQSYQIKGGKVTFFVNTLVDIREIKYNVIPTLVGTFVAPPAEMFMMYDPATVVYSDASQIGVAEKEAAPDETPTTPTTPPDEPTTPTTPVVPPADKPINPPVKPPVTPVLPAEPEAEPELPDLTVLSMATIGKTVVGQQVTFILTIGLSGFESKVPLKVEAYIDGRLVRTENVQLSRNYREFTVDFAWQVTAGAHTIRVFIDPNNVVCEKDEHNNEWMGEYNIAAQTSSGNGSAVSEAVLERTAFVLLALAVVAVLYRPARNYLARRKMRTVTTAGSTATEEE